jgi:hypothetical protein
VVEIHFKPTKYFQNPDRSLPSNKKEEKSNTEN